MGHGDGNGILNGNSPWWVKAILQVGVPAALALFLVWFVTLGPDRSDASTTRAHTVNIETSLNRHIQHTEQLHRTIEEYMRVNTLLMRHLCVTTAKSNGDDTTPCWQP